VRVGDRAVIPVASVRAAGGSGWGHDGDRDGDGGGFIDVGPEGARFEPIEDRRSTVRAIAGGAAGLLLLRGVVERSRRLPAPVGLRGPVGRRAALGARAPVKLRARARSGLRAAAVSAPRRRRLSR
jgi:hypothetical protein